VSFYSLNPFCLDHHFLLSLNSEIVVTISPKGDIAIVGYPVDIAVTRSSV